MTTAIGRVLTPNRADCVPALSPVSRSIRSGLTRQTEPILSILRFADYTPKWQGNCRTRGRLNRYSEARSISRAKASASFRRSITSAESLPIRRSRRTVGKDPNP